jgi:hypothetical protein
MGTPRKLEDEPRPVHVNERTSPDFAYLAHHDARLGALATQAGEHFWADPIRLP